jgi:hypothetical protein
VTQTVVLAVGLSAYTGEAMAVHNTLETLTFGSTDDIHERHTFLEDVRYGESVAKLEFALEISRKLDKFAHGSDPCLCEVALEGLAGVLFCGFVIGKLHCGIAVFFYSADLRDNARTSLDDGAWKILSISTENGSHSDFFSN